MNASSPSADDGQLAELERLRARAYGPDADIAWDAAAQARLEELESGHPTADPARTPSAALRSPPEERSAAERTGAAATGAQRTGDTGLSPVAEPRSVPDPTDEQIPTPRRPWSPRRRWIVLGGGVAVLAIAVTASTWLAPRAPDYVLHRASQQPEEPPTYSIGGYLDGLGIDGDVRSYEEFRGLSVWSGTSRYGTECIVITHRRLGGTGGCSTDGLVPTVDLTPAQGWGDEVFRDMPIGSLVRFQLEGDHVSVYLSSATPVGSTP